MGTDPAFYSSPGIIYFTLNPGGAFVLTPATIGTAFTWSTLRQYSLTLQGGWNGLDGASGFDISGQTDFGANPVRVGTAGNFWLGDIIINQVTIDGTAGDGLTVITTGNIALEDVHSQNNRSFGALLYAANTKNVSVQSSSFNNNSWSGLRIEAGSITLSNITADYNSGIGAMLWASQSVSISNSYFDGNTADFGGSAGLYVASPEDVRLEGVSASTNREGTGAVIRHFSSLSIQDSTFSGNAFSSLNYSTFGPGTNGWGLHLDASPDASISLNNVDISNNSNPYAGGMLIFTQGGDTRISCSRITDNGGVGLNASYASGTLWLNDVVLSGNGGGPYTGSPIITADSCDYLPPSRNTSLQQLHIVPVQGGEQVALECPSYSATRLVLANGNSAVFPCPLRDQGQLTELEAGSLPGPPPDSYQLISALEINVIQDGQPLDPADPSLTIDFAIPEDQTASALTILHWDGCAWVEFSGASQGAFFSLTTDRTGIFVLASK